MVAGLPGTGIGGFFFLLNALLMPLVELGKTAQGRSSLKRWRFVLTQSGLAVGIMTAMWATGWLIGQMLFALSHARGASVAGVALQAQNFVRTPPILFTLGTLLTVLIGVGVLRRVFSPKAAVPAQ